MSEAKIKKQVVDLSTAVYKAMREIGIPQPGYPAPVANAYVILWQAVGCPTPYAPDKCWLAPGQAETVKEVLSTAESKPL